MIKLIQERKYFCNNRNFILDGDYEILFVEVEYV
jgi:hypothetical protein